MSFPKFYKLVDCSSFVLIVSIIKLNVLQTCDGGLTVVRGPDASAKTEVLGNQPMEVGGHEVGLVSNQQQSPNFKGIYRSADFPRQRLRRQQQPYYQHHKQQDQRLSHPAGQEALEILHYKPRQPAGVDALRARQLATQAVYGLRHSGLFENSHDYNPISDLSDGDNLNLHLDQQQQQHQPVFRMTSSPINNRLGGLDEIEDLLSSASHQVVHVHGASSKSKGHGKYLWPIVGGGLTMLMGFLIISNMLLSIPLLAIGASSLFSQPGGSFQSQQLVPVYNLSQLLTTRAPSGRRRRRSTRAIDDAQNTLAPASGLPRVPTNLSPLTKGTRLVESADEGTTRALTKAVELNPDSQASESSEPRQSRQLLEAKIERLIDSIVDSAREKSARRLFFGGLSRKQVLKAAYCRRAIIG